MKTLELKDKINYLQNKIELKEKMFEVREKEIQLEEKVQRKSLETQLIKCQAENKQLIARMDEHPYKLVSDMLKALVVKFPTLNINDLAINSGKK